MALQFGAGTWPERLKGFNRFGATQELVRIEHGSVTESSYYGIMTAAHEANLSQAEQAFQTRDQSIAVSVGYGASTAAGCVSSVEHEAVPATYSWPDCPKLMGELRDRLPGLKDADRAAQRPVLPTFLYAVREAILSGRPHASAHYTHNGEVYTLTTARRAANRLGETVITGQICREQSRGQTEFRLWMASDPDVTLPTRIEFRAKNYLKLTLELDDRETIPVFARILNQTES